MVCKNCGYPNVILTCPDCGHTQALHPGLPAPSKKRARLPVLLLCAMFAVGLLVFFLLPLDGTSAPYFRVSEGVLYFDAEAYDGGPVLTVPESVKGENVTALSVGCFENSTFLTTVNLPDTLTEIRERAFSGCSELRGIKIPEGTQSIGAGAFRGCTSLEAVYLPGSITRIGTDAFDGCSSLFYLFYSGLYQNLQQLYPDEINPYTWAICLDGEYPYMPD